MKAHKLHEEVFPRTTLLPNIGLLVEVGRRRPERIATLEGTLAWQIEEATRAWWRGRGGGARKTSNCAGRWPIGDRRVTG